VSRGEGSAGSRNSRQRARKPFGEEISWRGTGPSDVRDALAHPHLAGARLRAEARSQVERAAAIAAVDGHRLAGIEPDADAERQRRIERSLVGERQLELHGRAQRVPGRLEDSKRLVAAELDHLAAMRFDSLARNFRERRRETGCGFVPVPLLKLV
jgi:hypothetical protein